MCWIPVAAIALSGESAIAMFARGLLSPAGAALLDLLARKYPGVAPGCQRSRAFGTRRDLTIPLVTSGLHPFCVDQRLPGRFVHARRLVVGLYAWFTRSTERTDRRRARVPA
jgi:hypothetical protein